MIIVGEKIGYPIRHKSKVPFLPKIDISMDVALKNADIFRMDSELDRYILTGKDHEELLIDAVASNIHHSTRIEGNPLTLPEVKQLTRRSIREGLPERPLDFPSQEVMNHIKAYFLSQYSEKWTLRVIQEMHRELMAGDTGARPGMFRNDRRIIETDEGQEVFIACPPEHIVKELASLLTWFNTTGRAHFPVITGSIFFHEFESIHPFDDGNGRCGRTLFHVYLQHSGLTNSRMCLIEKDLLSDPEMYYDILTRTDHFGDYNELIIHFTEAVWSCYRSAVDRYKGRDLLASDLDTISRQLLVISKQYGGWFTMNDIRKWVPGHSDFILRSRLSDLVEIGAIQEEGETKGKRYRFADPFRSFLDDIRRKI